MELTSRNLFGLILSICSSGAMIWACTFDVQQIVTDDLRKMTGGKLKFLTIINLHIQAFYYCLCIINFFIGSNSIVKEERSRIQKLRDFLFATIIFPLALFVCITFWGLYFIDRKLIYPDVLDQVISPFLNHVMHTLPGMAVCLESFVHHHRYPSRISGPLFFVVISTAYVVWIHYLNYKHWNEHKKDVWVYPILKELSYTYRMVFLFGMTLFGVGLYFIGEMLILSLTNMKEKKAQHIKKQN